MNCAAVGIAPFVISLQRLRHYLCETLKLSVINFAASNAIIAILNNSSGISSIPNRPAANLTPKLK